ncbi:MAG: hypothetical protein M3Z27_00205 [Actinomycetota bacterium]|nr:hypothetical protein [Actinomycetota bacterium]
MGGFYDGTANVTLGERWDGTSWTVQATQNPNGNRVSGLGGVSCTSATACTAAGESCDISECQNPLAESWDGTSWTIQATPIPPNNNFSGLGRVSCTSATACTAVGNGNNGVLLAERWDGASWTIPSIPSPAGATSGNLEGVSCSAPTACTAVGSYYDGAGDTRTLAERWDGSTWIIQPTPTPGAPATVVTGSAAPAQTSAGVSGTVNPNGIAVGDCRFDYGTTTGYGSSAPCSTAVGGGSSPVSVSATLSGLLGGTVYHYRLEATATGGTAAYGNDATFTTGGGSSPTASTGSADWAYGDASAALKGTLNPHGNDTSYTFYWGTSSVSASSPADLTGYSHSTGPGSAGNGTSSVDVSQQISPVAADTVYYYRLVAQNAAGTSIGEEQQFEVTAPPARDTGRPYLQDSGGFDPEQGFFLKCVPGAWQGSNGHYTINWVYVGADGQLTSARGATRNFDRDGDGYHVSAVDVSHVLACEVTAHALDGGTPPGSSALSDLFVPTTPELSLPPWFKNAFNLAKKALSLHDAGDALRTCLEFADLPGWGETFCGLEIVSLLANLKLDDMVGELDPPDSHYRQIALPRPPGRAYLGKVCPPRLKRSSCARFGRVMQRYRTASASVSSLVDSVSVVLNRFLIARRVKDSSTELVQTAAFKVYAGVLAAAYGDQHQASIALARELRRDRLNLRLSSGRLRHTQLPRPGALVRRPSARGLLARGLTRGMLRAALGLVKHQPRASIGAFDLQRALGDPVPPIPYTREYDTLGLNDLEALLAAFVQQHGLLASAATRLYADIDQARAACTLKARSARLGKLLSDARPSLSAGYDAFLQRAVQPIAGGQASTDRYPHC